MDLRAAALLAATVGAVIARQLLRRGPPTWVLFLLGALGMAGSGALPLGGAEAAVAGNLPILVFLFALFVFVGGLQQSGALDHLARWTIGRAGRPRDLPLVLFVVFGVLSAFMLNDALVLVGVPLLLALAQRLRVPAEPLLLTLMFSVTVGSLPLPFGNPQNLLVSLDSGVRGPVATFLRYLLLPTIANVALGGWYLRRRYGPAFSGAGADAPRIPFFPPGNLLAHARRFPVLLLFPVTMIVLVTLDVTSALTNGPTVPLGLVALGGALVMVAVTPGRAAVIGRVDWTILLLFAGLFVVVAGAVNGGVIQGVESVVRLPGPGQPGPAIGTILLTSVVGSQVVSNVPWVGLQIPVLAAAGYTGAQPWAWMALAGGATLAGNLTLLGAASNLIVVEQAERAGVRIGLRTFVRDGLPLTAMTLAVLYVFLLVGL